MLGISKRVLGWWVDTNILEGHTPYIFSVFIEVVISPRSW